MKSGSTSSNNKKKLEPPYARQPSATSSHSSKSTSKKSSSSSVNNSYLNSKTALKVGTSKRSTEGGASSKSEISSYLQSNDNCSSPSKKLSKMLDKSPTKKSQDILKKMSQTDLGDQASIDDKPIRKFTNDLSDVGGRKLPAIVSIDLLTALVKPEHEIAEFMIEEDLSEVDRIKVLLTKTKNQDQLSYFFNNIENIFEIEKKEFFNLFGGNEYASIKQRLKDWRFNYETQPSFGNEYLLFKRKMAAKLKQSHQSSSAISDPSPISITSAEDPSPAQASQKTEKQLAASSRASLPDQNLLKDAPILDPESDLAKRQGAIQDGVLPLVFGTWLQSQSEYIQILAGESFLTLLRSQSSFHFKKEHLINLKKESVVMLGQWSADILEIWTDCYALTLAKLIERVGPSSKEADEYIQECVRIVQRMTDRNQTIKVRIKAASLLGFLAKYNSLGDPDRYYKLLVANRLQQICQDLHWEVRKEMCSNLHHISMSIGQQFSHKHVLPELKELLDDEEGEVVTEAIIQYQKHIDFVFTQDFTQTEEALHLFLRLADLTIDCDMCLVDLSKVLRKIGKYLVAFNRPSDQRIQQRVVMLLQKAKNATFDDEVRANIPSTFEGICYVYVKSPEFLWQVYWSHLSQFLKKEIESGKPPEKKQQKTNVPKSIYYDIIEKEKSKHHRETFDDQNYLVNRAISQNLHYFFGAFLSILEKRGDVDSDDEDNLTPGRAVDYDLIESCAIDVLENYQRLLLTKDRELLHYVLFSMKNFHEAIMKVKLWIRLPDQLKDLYMKIVKTEFRDCEQHLVHSWRYHTTFLKVQETIIDSQFEMNETYTQYINELKSDFSNPQKQKMHQEYQYHNKQFQAFVQAERKESVKNFISILQDKGASNPARKYACKVLSSLVSRSKLSKLRAYIFDNVIKISKQKTLQQKQTYIMFVEELLQGEHISSALFQKHYYDPILKIFEEPAKVQNLHLKIIKSIFEPCLKLLFNNQTAVDKLLSQLAFLRTKCDMSFQATNEQSLSFQLLEEIEKLSNKLKDQQQIKEFRAYLVAQDVAILAREEGLNGGVQNIELSSNKKNSALMSQLTQNEGKPSKSKSKPISVRTASSYKQAPQKQEKQEKQSSGQQPPAPVAELPPPRVSSMRPPSQSFSKRSVLPFVYSRNNEQNQQYTKFKDTQQSPLSNERRIVKGKHNSNYNVGGAPERMYSFDENTSKGLQEPKGSKEQNPKSQDRALKQNTQVLNKENNRFSLKINPTNQARLRTDSRGSTEKSMGESTSQSEKISKAKANIILAQNGASNLSTTRLLPPRTIGIAATAPHQAAKAVNLANGTSSLPVKMSLIDQYRTTQQNLCYHGAEELKIEERRSQKQDFAGEAKGEARDSKTQLLKSNHGSRSQLCSLPGNKARRLNSSTCEDDFILSEPLAKKMALAESKPLLPAKMKNATINRPISSTTAIIQSREEVSAAGKKLLNHIRSSNGSNIIQGMPTQSTLNLDQELKNVPSPYENVIKKQLTPSLVEKEKEPRGQPSQIFGQSSQAATAASLQSQQMNKILRKASTSISPPHMVASKPTSMIPNIPSLPINSLDMGRKNSQNTTSKPVSSNIGGGFVAIKPNGAKATQFKRSNSKQVGNDSNQLPGLLSHKQIIGNKQSTLQQDGDHGDDLALPQKSDPMNLTILSREIKKFESQNKLNETAANQKFQTYSTEERQLIGNHFPAQRKMVSSQHRKSRQGGKKTKQADSSQQQSQHRVGYLAGNSIFSKNNL